jgi:hypothetical protein
MIRFSVRLLAWLCAMGTSTGCSLVVGADFDRNLRPSDASFSDAPGMIPPITDPRSLEAGRPIDDVTPEKSSGDALPDVVDETRPDASADGGGSVGNDASNCIDASDCHDVNDANDINDANHVNDGGDAGAIDAGPDSVVGPTVVIGGFVSLGPRNQLAAPIELRGQIISNAIIRGSSASGITIEGRFQ